MLILFRKQHSYSLGATSKKGQTPHPPWALKEYLEKKDQEINLKSSTEILYINFEHKNK